MADNTLLGIAGVVLISLIAALFFAVGNGSNVQIDSNIGTGQAAYQGATNVNTCQAQRICDGSKLIIIREDCSTAEAFCAEGCDALQGLCI